MASIAFKPRTSFMIVGASGSEKTYWVYKFLRHLPDMFQDPAPEKILYCYGIYQPLFDDMKQNIPHLIFHQGLPDKEEMEQFAGHTLLVLDDLMSDVSNSKPMQDLFCQYCHHMGINVMYPEPLPPGKMRKNYCTQHPRASIDEEHAQCFPGELCGKTALSRSSQNARRDIPRRHERTLWLPGDRHVSSRSR